MATEKSLSVNVKTEGVAKYRVQFIGHGGQVLTELNEPSASYTFKGHEGYVRAKVIESHGAWPGCSRFPRPAVPRLLTADGWRRSRSPVCLATAYASPGAGTGGPDDNLVVVRTNLQSV